MKMSDVPAIVNINQPQIVDRWYQTEAVEAFLSFVMRERDPLRNPVLVLPTGTGKSVIIARIIQRALTQWSDTRVLMLSHVGELVRQDAEKLAMVWPKAQIGICSATLGSKDTATQILFGNVQSVAPILKRNPSALGQRHLIIIDECHLLSDDDNSQYRQVISALRGQRSTMRVLGLSATPYRIKGGLLTQQKNAIFTDIIYDLSKQINRLISEGYLSAIKTLRTAQFIDLTGVKTRAGEYSKDDINRVLTSGDTLEEACKFIRNIGQTQKRRAWLVFVTGIDAGERAASYLKALGVSVAAVNSSHPSEENEQAMRDFRSGALTCLVSADQLTTGFDAPNIDLIGMLRPTKSTSLHVQMIGRGLRVAPGKTDCLVLDFARNIERLGPINAPYIPEPSERKSGDKAKRAAQVKICPHCEMYVDIHATECPYCGTKFATCLEADGLDAEVLSSRDEANVGIKPEKGNSIVVIHAKHGRRHVGSSGVPCFDLSYSYEHRGKVRNIHIYMCFEHQGRIRSKASDLWQFYGGQLPAPMTSAEAVQRINELKSPVAFEIKMRNFYQNRLSDEIIKVFWPEDLQRQGGAA